MQVHMIDAYKVDQTLFGAGQGNCFTACISTITGIPLQDIPNFCVIHDGAAWYIECQKWLRTHGLALWNTVSKGDDLRWVDVLLPDIPWIASGPNTRGIMHCCVYIGSKLWHDPNPLYRDGLVEVEDATFFLKTLYR